jgi:aminobenzoyl-glutamate utilization protein B
MSMLDPSATIHGHAEAVAPKIIEAADQLWRFSEIGLHEHQSSAYLKALLTQHGFTITAPTVGALPTAFIAEYGVGAPIIGILCEYDALPGLGNAAVPRPEPRADGLTTGQGCGHNLIGSGAVGAALAVRAWLEASQTPGTVRLYGCPAEENWYGKVLMAREGVFNDLDAALHWHPLDNTATANVRTTATSRLSVEFFGKTAHAGNSPWEGRSALHALELFAHGVNLMREHLHPTSRVQYIFKVTGVATNVVPDYASAEIAFRGDNPDHVAAGIAWLRDIVAGAAHATQTTSKVTFRTGTNDLLPNTPLAQRTQHILETLDTPDYSAAEQEFARTVQKALGLPEKGMLRAVLPLMPELSMGGATDVGDVSKITPTMGFVLPTIPAGVSLHTWAVTACAGMSIGHKAAIHAAKVLATLAAELFTDADLRAAAKADFTKRMGGKAFVSLLPADATGLPEGMSPDPTIKRAEDEFVGNAMTEKTVT